MHASMASIWEKIEKRECIFKGGFPVAGDLDSFVKKNAKAGLFLSEDEVMLKFVQITLALHHVHSTGIIHRDLKSNNVFCCSNGIVKLGDFGIAKATTSTNYARTMVGTPYYMSPEILKVCTRV